MDTNKPLIGGITPLHGQMLISVAFLYGLEEGNDYIVHYFPEGSNDRADLKTITLRLDALGEPGESGH